MRSASPHRATQSALILLVDDNNDGILARRSVLEELGYTVVAANSGEEALNVVENQAIDLVVTDYKMKPLNGIELIARLRELRPQLPLILLTGFAEPLGLKPENTGASLVLQKSANELTTLLRSVKRLLQPPRKPPSSSSTLPKTPVRAKGAGQ